MEKNEQNYFHNMTDSYSFDFNSFKPLPVSEIKAIKEERKVLNKYGLDVSELDKKLSNYGLTEEELEMI